MSLLMKKRQKWEFLTSQEEGTLVEAHRLLVEIP